MTEHREFLPVLEGILFAMGNSVEIAALAETSELSPDETKILLDELCRSYKERESGIQLIFLEDKVQLCTKAEYYEYLIRLATRPKKPQLTNALMETLSIVAYKQPVTRIEIERIRGVKSDHAVNRLIEFGLIEEAGRLEAPGRPILFATTEDFLRSFGVSSLTELPKAPPEALLEWEHEAEEEVSVEL